MTISHHLARIFVTAAIFALGGGSLAVAQDRDAAEVSRYVLTDSGLTKFVQASRNLAGVPGACVEEDDDAEGAKSIDEVAAKLNSMPGAQAAIQSAGMTTREYVIFSFSIFQTGMASWALGQPGGKLPPGASQANVDFYRNHEAQLAALGKDDPCGDDSGDEDESEPETEPEPEE
jgi:hypothetical protein